MQFKLLFTMCTINHGRLQRYTTDDEINIIRLMFYLFRCLSMPNIENITSAIKYLSTFIFAFAKYQI